MSTNPEKRRTPAQQRARNLRLLIVLVGIVAVFFVGIMVKQVVTH
jgi:hypothetical protein